MNVARLGRIVQNEGKQLAKKLRRAGYTADQFQRELEADPVCREDAEPWIAIDYLRRWERRPW